MSKHEGVIWAIMALLATPYIAWALVKGRVLARRYTFDRLQQPFYYWINLAIWLILAAIFWFKAFRSYLS